MEKERFHQLRSIMYKTFEEEKYTESKQLAKEYLELAKLRKTDWNYGNAIHHSNLLLGRISLKEGAKEEAKNYLLKAAKTPGSPQLNTFGPNMLLASELLELGEHEVVIEYIELCKRFWIRLFSWTKIRSWRRIIKRGEIPNFKANLVY